MPANDRPTAPTGAFLITRSFDAPRRLVWQAWSEAGGLQAWWGPKGCTVAVKTLEFRPGGFFHYAMRFPDGALMWGRFLYREIAPPERIVWLNSFSNEGCGITRAPFDSAIPLEIVNEATFAEAAGKTTVTLRARPHGAAANEVEVFEGMFASLNQGYGGTFDRLAAALAEA
ncbi:MAG TPA: SRPBCC domain-containing protein [Candidatus Acidoferrum sp.]|nr:SRPBCC domain-containing protein [Candidatus Acidoferrum sp.]